MLFDYSSNAISFGGISMGINNGHKKLPKSIYQTAGGFRNLSKAFSALDINLEDIVKSKELPELERLQRIKVGYDSATSSFYQDAVINGKKVRHDISDETFFAFAQKYMQQYGVRAAEHSQAPTNIVSMDNAAYTGAANNIVSNHSRYLGIAAAGLVALVGLLADVGCRNRKNIRRPIVPLTNAEFAAAKAVEYSGKSQISVPKLPLGYQGTPVKNPDGTIETVVLSDKADVAKSILYTGDDLPTDEVILNSSLNIVSDSKGEPVSATYLNAKLEKKDVNPLALKLAYIANAQGSQVDNNGVVYARSFSIARYLIVFNQLADGKVDISKENRELHAGGTSLASLGMRYQDAGINGLLARVLRLAFGIDDNVVPSFTYNIKFFNDEASDYFRQNIAKPAFEKAFLYLLDEVKIRRDKLDTLSVAAKDGANAYFER